MSNHTHSPYTYYQPLAPTTHTTMASLFGFGPSAKVEIEMDGADAREKITVENGPEKNKSELLIYKAGDIIEGKIKVVKDEEE